MFFLDREAAGPGRELWIWDDMFNPHHNAHDGYFLINGTVAGSWEGIPAVRERLFGAILQYFKPTTCQDRLGRDRHRTTLKKTHTFLQDGG